MPKSLTACALIVMAGFSSVALAAEEDNPLLAERWQTRPLIILAKSANDPVLVQLKTALEEPRNREAFVERDMVLYTVVGDTGDRNDKPLTPAQTEALVRALRERPEDQALVILVGKDGGKKIVQRGGINPAEIFTTIDQMPMRQP
ncbi:uncharacterized protein DUF4174 [Pseudomonas duriflava]|uniref:Uncharacterized protein DUF4174 n=1 Tax=Pseudomonas duriflava TaxID=459528 RepID=A0A562QFI2_9PSED|nr:DUF4174 domain-containing protein [Pseudomonas duriflava]TWI55453.1 uncharacterized protein DUF4174 [Pseudomonas duriflava]